MDRRARTNLFLVVAVAALGTFIAFAPEREEKPEGVPLFSPDEAITVITVMKGDATQFVLRAHGDEWRLEQPAALPADQYQIDMLLDMLRTPNTRHYAVADANLAELGLEQPEWRLRVNDVELSVGGTSAIGGQRYVRKGERIHLASEVLMYRLQRNPYEYASKQLLPPNAAIAAITLPDGTRIERADPGWTTIPERENVSADALQKLVNAWSEAHALSVGPASSVARDEVLIELEGGESLRFGVEMRETELLLSRAEPAVTYRLTTDAAGELLQLPAPSAESSADE